jgi:hypothetical protein
VPPVKIVEEQHYIGRGKNLAYLRGHNSKLTTPLLGGAANTYKPSEEEIKAAKEHNEKVRTSSIFKG